MQVAQIAPLMNSVTSEVLGQDAITVAEDLSNVIDLGNAIFNADAVENYARKLVDHIGRMVFVDRPYTGRAPRVLMDGWEFGSVLEKVRTELPEAEENESWELEDRNSYDPNVFYQPKVSAKFFNKRVTFEVPMSFTERQVKSAFSNAVQLNAFISMIYTSIENSMTVKLDALVMRTIDNMAAEVVYSEYKGAELNSKSGVRAVNLLKLYNDANSTELTAEAAITNPAFLRFAAYTLALYTDRMGTMSSLFNVGGTVKHTPRDRMHIVMLSDFARGADIYLQSDTFHNELTRLPGADLVPYWQGSGTGYSFADVSNVNVKTASGNTVSVTGLLAVVFDRDALGVTNMDRRTTTNYNPKAEFVSEWHKMDAGYFNDLDENFVAFFVA